MVNSALAQQLADLLFDWPLCLRCIANNVSRSHHDVVEALGGVGNGSTLRADTSGPCRDCGSGAVPTYSLRAQHEAG